MPMPHRESHSVVCPIGSCKHWGAGGSSPSGSASTPSRTASWGWEVLHALVEELARRLEGEDMSRTVQASAGMALAALLKASPEGEETLALRVIAVFENNHRGFLTTLEPWRRCRLRRLHARSCKGVSDRNIRHQ
mmetsp:Transcript_10602/g.21232  ORF Transcript_10602/g.21232 Transcript_10602/m.21232 type:complete len:135 (-) Transcript_10602:14-418(-)